MSQNLSSAAVVIGALRVNDLMCFTYLSHKPLSIQLPDFIYNVGITGYMVNSVTSDQLASLDVNQPSLSFLAR